MKTQAFRQLRLPPTSGKERCSSLHNHSHENPKYHSPYCKTNYITLRNAPQGRVLSTLASYPNKHKTKPKHKLSDVTRLLSAITQAVFSNTISSPFHAEQAQTKRVLVAVRPAVFGALTYFVVPFPRPLSRNLNFVQVLLSDPSLSLARRTARSVSC